MDSSILFWLDYSGVFKKKKNFYKGFKFLILSKSTFGGSFAFALPLWVKKNKRNCKVISWLIGCQFGNGNIYFFFFNSFFMRLCTTTLTIQAWAGPTCIPQGSMYLVKAFTIINTKINSIYFIMNLYQLHNTYLFVFLDMLRCHHILYSIYGHEVFMSVFWIYW